MSETPRPAAPRSGGLGRPLLWLVSALSVTLLSFVTVQTTRSNPLYSDREANGISKYKFLEECKHLATTPDELTVGAMGQALPIKALVEQSRPLNAGERIDTSLEVESRQLVRAVDSVSAGGWSLNGLPVTIAVVGPQGRSTLGQLPMQCTHDKKTGKTTAQLQLPGQ